LGDHGTLIVAAKRSPSVEKFHLFPRCPDFPVHSRFKKCWRPIVVGDVLGGVRFGAALEWARHPCVITTATHLLHGPLLRRGYWAPACEARPVHDRGTPSRLCVLIFSHYAPPRFDRPKEWAEVERRQQRPGILRKLARAPPKCGWNSTRPLADRAPWPVVSAAKNTRDRVRGCW